MDTTGTIIFLDTETTSLRPDRRVWELGAVVRRLAAPEQRVHRFVYAEDLDLGNADPFSLDIGGYYRRHPQAVPVPAGVPIGAELHSEAEALAEFEYLSRGALIAGNVVNFDTEVIAARMRAHGLLPGWHYHLCDVEALAAGYLRGRAVLEPGAEVASSMLQIAEPPWDSGELSQALGIDPGKYERHTAMGDADWARDLYDKVMGNRAR